MTLACDLNELWIGSGRNRRWARIWTPANNVPSAAVCVVHGLGEHSGRYADFAQRLTEAGFATLAFDLQGHGQSHGWRGCITSFDSLLQDIATGLDYLADQFPSLPRILFGHSMGGALVLNYILRDYPRPALGISSGAFLRMAKPLTPCFHRTAILLSLVLPHLRFKTPVRAEILTHDAGQQQKYRDDNLVHRRISLRLGAEVLAAGEWAIQHAGHLDIPALVLHGAADELTSPQASIEFAQCSNSLCKLNIFDGMFHDLHREMKREQVFQTMFEWIDKSLAAA